MPLRPPPGTPRGWGSYPSGRFSAPSDASDIDDELISELMYRQDAAQAAWDSLREGKATLKEALGDIASTIPRWSPLVEGTAIAAFLQHPGAALLRAGCSSAEDLVAAYNALTAWAHAVEMLSPPAMRRLGTSFRGGSNELALGDEEEPLVTGAPAPATGTPRRSSDEQLAAHEGSSTSIGSAEDGRAAAMRTRAARLRLMRAARRCSSPTPPCLPLGAALHSIA